MFFSNPLPLTFGGGHSSLLLVDELQYQPGCSPVVLWKCTGYRWLCFLSSQSLGVQRVCVDAS